MATEAPNDLISISNVKILDMLGEGQISGFVWKDGAYGKDPLCATYYDGVPVRNPDGSYNYNVSGRGYSFDYTFGTKDQSVLNGFSRVENIIPLGGNTRVANPPAGAGLQKYVIAAFNTATYPDSNSVKVTVRVPALYAVDTTNGNTNGYRLSYAVDISLNGAAFTTVDTQTIIGKCTSHYLKETTYVLPKGTPSDFYDYKIRVRRTSQNNIKSSTANELFVESIAVVSTNSFNYPHTALVSTSISAEQFGSVPVRAYEIFGLLLNVPDGHVPTTYHADGTLTAASYPAVWNGTWSATRRWSDNPAWVFFDLVTNPRYGLGAYIPSGSVDKWTLYEIAQYCDELVDDGDGGLEPRFTCNFALYDRQDAYQVLQNLTSVFRGMMYYGNGRIFTTQTSTKNPVCNYTNANVVEGKFTYADTATNVRSTVIVVKWTDPANLYRETVEYVEDREGIARYGYNVKEITAFACTSKGQAYRIGNWMLQSERLLTETVTFQVGLDGLYVRPGDVFQIYDNFRNNKDQGGRITNIIDGTGIILDRYVELTPDVTYILSCSVPSGNSMTGTVSSDRIYEIRSEQIESRIVTNWSSLDERSPTTIQVFGEFSDRLYPGAAFLLTYSGSTGAIYDGATQYKCLATAETAPGTVEILGLQYNTGINIAAETNYTTVSNPVNAGDTETIDPVTDLTAEIIDGVYNDNSYFRYIKLDWTDTPSTNLGYYIVSGKPFGGTYSILDKTTSPTLNYTPTVTGRHDFVVIARSIGGIESTPATVDITIPSTSPVGEPPSFADLEISEDYNSDLLDINENYTGYVGTTPTFRWTNPNGADSPALGGNPDYLHTGSQFISGYKVYLQRYNSDAVAGPWEISGINNTSFEFDRNFLNTGDAGNPIRGFHLFVEIVDYYDNHVNGGAIDVNNPAPRSPQDSGFFAIRGGLNYTIVPNAYDNDISGAYIWVNETGAFVPKMSQPTLKTTNLAGFITNQQTGLYYVWYSLIDDFGTGNCPIYGPVSVQPGMYVTSGEANLMDSGVSGVLRGHIAGLSGMMIDMSGALRSGIKDCWTIVLSDEESPIETGRRVTWRAPCAASIYKITAELTTSGTNLSTYDILRSGSSFFSTKPTIDANETETETAATPNVLSISGVNYRDPLQFYVLTTPTGGAGLKMKLYVTRSNDIP